MSVFGVRKEFSDVNTPKTSISASAKKWGHYKKCGPTSYNSPHWSLLSPVGPNFIGERSY